MEGRVTLAARWRCENASLEKGKSLRSVLVAESHPPCELSMLDLPGARLTSVMSSGFGRDVVALRIASTHLPEQLLAFSCDGSHQSP
eukprot:3506823-Amphidinium_carterae.1